jgi:hypothetical protein
LLWLPASKASIGTDWQRRPQNLHLDPQNLHHWFILLVIPERMLIMFLTAHHFAVTDWEDRNCCG